MWVNENNMTVMEEESYTGADGTHYPHDFPKGQIPNLTYVQPIPCPATTLYQDSTYEVVSGVQVWTVTDWSPEQITQAIQSAKALKWEAIKAERDGRITSSGVFVDGNWYHSDNQFRGVITQACRLFAIDETPDDNPVKIAIAQQLSEVRGKPWKTMSNQFVTPTHLLAIKIDAAHAVLTQGCHYQAEVHKTAMEASGDPSEYDFSTGWPATFTA